MRALILVLLLIPMVSEACSCIARPIDVLVNKADYIYIGRAMTASVAEDDKVISELEVKQIIKGKPESTQMSSTAKLFGLCEQPVFVGGEYLIFGYSGKRPILSICSDSRLKELLSEKEMGALVNNDS